MPMDPIDELFAKEKKNQTHVQLYGGPADGLEMDVRTGVGSICVPLHSCGGKYAVYAMVTTEKYNFHEYRGYVE